MNSSKKLLLSLILGIVLISSLVSGISTLSSPFLSWISSNNENIFVYEPNNSFELYSEWNSSSLIQNVTILSNISGVQTISQANQITPNNWSFNINNLPAGIYFWNMTAQNEENLSANSPTFTLEITKKSPNLTLELNNQSGDINITENETLNISAKLIEGESSLKLYLNNQLFYEHENNISVQGNLNPGYNNLTLVHEESQNYTNYEITKNVFVKEIPFNVSLNKNIFDLGETALFEINANQNASVKITTLGATCNASGFVITINEQTHNSNYPFIGNLYNEKAGDYCLVVDLLGQGKQKKLDFKVRNSLDIRLQGNLIVKPSQKTALTADARFGFSPYTYKWLLDDGWKQVNGNKLEETFTQTGNYPVILQVTDSKGNTKNESFEISVKNSYKLTVFVRDYETDSLMNNVDVIVEDKVLKTGSNGRVEFEVFEGISRVQAYFDNYNRYDQDVDVESNKELIIRLIKRSNSVVQSSQNAQNKITVISPIASQSVPRSVLFELEINPSSQSICKLYVAAENVDWFEEIKSFSVSTNQKISHTQEFTPGVYNWRVECTSGSNTYSTQTNKFTVNSNLQTTTTTNQESSFDAGNLRSKIEEAQNNLNRLSFEDQKSAVALDLQTIVNRALRDFDRTLRDINSMIFRRDLTQAQIDERVTQYQNDLINLEKTTPLNIKTIDSSTFVSYPSDANLLEISNIYKEEKNLVGNLNQANLKKLQDKIVVRTEALNSEITYVDGSTKQITIISKTIEYKENTSRGEFLLEKIPSSIGVSANDITFLQTMEVVLQNPLLKAQGLQNITYYFEGHIDLDLAEEFSTILLSEALYSNNQRTNYITGFVTAADIEFGTPVWSITVLILIILIYLAHAFDLTTKFIDLFSKSSREKVHQIKLLINDSQDYLDADNLERANLLFKEVKYNYEKSNDYVKKQVYEEAIKLHDALNLKYITDLLAKLEEALNQSDLDLTSKTYNAILDSVDALEQESARLVKDKLSKLLGLAKIKFPETFN
jgi:hypothetical protein